MMQKNNNRFVHTPSDEVANSDFQNLVQFYEVYPRILDSASLKSKITLSWTHYRTLIQELNPEARGGYEQN